jgi:uncharacterized membrane protein YfcA
MLGGIDYILVGLAAIAAGAVNALAGGGTLITFPMLTAVGVPAVAANVTNTVALCPGYLGATFAQLKDLQGQKTRLWLLIPVGIFGGIIGASLLLHTDESFFRALVPFLILLASGLLAVQDRLRASIARRSKQSATASVPKLWVVFPVGLAAIYGGYFGAGLSVIVLAVLGLVFEDTLTRLNASKQAIAFSVNIAAALFFLFSDKVVWSMVVVMAAGALLGGILGGRLASYIKPATLRWTVVAIGVVVAIIYFVS